MPYSTDQLAQLDDAYRQWADRRDELTTAILTRGFATERAKEFAQHGLSRRLNMLQHCLDRVFAIVPPDDRQPGQLALMDATAFIQTFVVNIYGAIDNLAHIWCIECDVRDHQGRPLAPMRIGLTPKSDAVRNSLPHDLQTYLVGHDEWFAYLEGYRHALAHRIPLYIPPRQLGPAAQEEFAALEAARSAAVVDRDWQRFGELGVAQEHVGVFEPYMMHSFVEQAHPMRFHGQLISDLATVVEIGERLLRALDAAIGDGDHDRSSRA
jgi:hypothetical protein